MVHELEIRLRQDEAVIEYYFDHVIKLLTICKVDDVACIHELTIYDKYMLHRYVNLLRQRLRMGNIHVMFLDVRGNVTVGNYGDVLHMLMMLMDKCRVHSIVTLLPSGDILLLYGHHIHNVSEIKHEKNINIVVMRLDVSEICKQLLTSHSVKWGLINQLFKHCHKLIHHALKRVR